MSFKGNLLNTHASCLKHIIETRLLCVLFLSRTKDSFGKCSGGAGQDHSQVWPHGNNKFSSNRERSLIGQNNADVNDQITMYSDLIRPGIFCYGRCYQFSQMLSVFSGRENELTTSLPCPSKKCTFRKFAYKIPLYKITI